MKPMYLPEVEANPRPSQVTDLIRIAQGNGAEYPKIWHLFGFRPEATANLGEFTQGIMRGEGPLSAGMRELIAAFTSYHNDCPF